MVTEADTTDEQSPTIATVSSANEWTPSYLGWDFEINDQTLLWTRGDWIVGYAERESTMFYAERESTMFSETIFKNNLVAVRSINSGNESALFKVEIYELVRVVVPYLILLTNRRFIRIFGESTMAARIRHSTNWIEKLDREYTVALTYEERRPTTNPYWLSDCAEWREGDMRRLFMKDVEGSVNVDRALQFLQTGNTGTATIEQRRVVEAFQAALNNAIPVGTGLRTSILSEFTERLRG